LGGGGKARWGPNAGDRRKIRRDKEEKDEQLKEKIKIFRERHQGMTGTI